MSRLWCWHTSLSHFWWQALSCQDGSSNKLNNYGLDYQSLTFRQNDSIDTQMKKTEMTPITYNNNLSNRKSCKTPIKLFCTALCVWLATFRNDFVSFKGMVYWNCLKRSGILQFNIKIIWLRKWKEISKLGFWFFFFNTEKTWIFSENLRTIDDFRMNRIWMNNPI